MTVSKTSGPTLSLVAAVAENGVIGRGGAMPWHLPADLAHFKRTTMGKPIVMGRHTFEAIGRPLPGRRNIVVSGRPGFAPEGVEVAPDLAAALALTGDAEEVMVIGGGTLYRAALPLARRIYLTRVHGEFEGDTRFPDLAPADWRESAREERRADDRNPWPLSFVTLERMDAGR